MDTTLEDFQLEFKDLQVVSRTEFDVLQSNLRDMEEECKNSLGYINLDSNYSSDTKNLVSLFLENATQRIISMKIIITRVMAEYQKFLFWFGLPLHLHKVGRLNNFLVLIVEWFKLQLNLQLLSIMIMI